MGHTGLGLGIVRKVRSIYVRSYVTTMASGAEAAQAARGPVLLLVGSHLQVPQPCRCRHQRTHRGAGQSAQWRGRRSEVQQVR